jgi:hypothetical protein
LFFIFCFTRVELKVIERRKEDKKRLTWTRVWTSLECRQGCGAGLPARFDFSGVVALAAEVTFSDLLDESVAVMVVGHFSKIRTLSATEPRVKNGRIGMPVEVYWTANPTDPT